VTHSQRRAAKRQARRSQHPAADLSYWLKWVYYSTHHPGSDSEALADWRARKSLRAAWQERGLPWDPSLIASPF
jgi:hypothetical protein